MCLVTIVENSKVHVDCMFFIYMHPIVYASYPLFTDFEIELGNWK